MTPYFSVVIPLYNKERFIENTLNCVLNQTFKDFEIIVINDGSTDNSLKKVNLLKDERTRVYTQNNSGLSSARNEGIKKAQADYIAFLDADDLWMEDYLETIYNLISSYNSHNVFSTSFKTLTPKDNINLTATKFYRGKSKIITNYYDLTISKITPSSLVLKRAILETIGYFDETINYAEDEDLYIRCFAKENLIFYTESKAYYRTGFESQMTSPNPQHKRIIPDFEKYLNTNNTKLLKPYLDFVHFKLVVLYKMEKNYNLVSFYKEKIDTSNLTMVQKIKYHLPSNIFYYLKSLYIQFFKR